MSTPRIRTRLLLSLAALAPTAAAQQSYTAELVVDGLDGPLFVTAAPGDDERLFVAEQEGVLRRIEPDGSAHLLLDLTDLVDAGYQHGLMGFAFHPEYDANGFFYVYYVAGSTETVLVRYRVPVPSTYDVDPASATVLLSVTAAITFHAGGGLAFAPDGKLWLAIGDLRVELPGAGCSAQDPSTLVGKLLRLNDDGTIPDDNPFVDDPSVRDEICAFGLRQPFRMSFDSATGDLYLGDVGESSREEINFVPAGTLGLNFGWRVLEGSLCTPSTECTALPCPDAAFTAPVFEYGHFFGCSAIGGHVYRGADVPELAGLYLYGDWCTGAVGAFRYDGVGPVVPVEITDTLTLGTGVAFDHVSSFGTDNREEVYIVDGGLLGVDGTGRVLKIVPKSLTADVTEVSVAAGGAQVLELDAGADNAGDLYVVLGSASGIWPGIPLGQDTIPLNFDFYTAASLTGDPPLFDSIGNLGPSGQATASFALPPGSPPAWVGTELHHAFAAVDPASLQLQFLSNPEPVVLAP